jgi:hydroxypyruvate isomerase
MLFTELPFLERFGAAARAGFDAVEFLFPYEHGEADIARELRTHDLVNVLFNLPPGNWAAGERGLAALPGREAEFRAGLALALRYARSLATPRLHVMAGVVPPGGDRERCRSTFVANLRYAAAEAAREGIDVLIEPLNPRDMPGYLHSTQAEAHAIREEVGAENLKVQMDLYHAQIVEGDLTVKLRRWLPYIGHIQIAGVPDRHEPDAGELDYGYLLRLLDELGYAGWVGCEYRPARGTVEGLGWIERLGVRGPAVSRR